MAQQTTKPKQTIIRDSSEKKFFGMIPHLARLLPMSPFSKLLYWDYVAIASQYADDLDAMSQMLTGVVTAKRLGFSSAMVSFCKRELIAFELITITTEGTRDVIDILNIWGRNKDHFTSGTPDPMISSPPDPSTYRSVRKHERKAAKKGAAEAGQVSWGETSNAPKFHPMKLEVSPYETSQTTNTGSNIYKEVLEVRTEEEGRTKEKPLLRPSPQPVVGNPVAAPNAPNPPRALRKPNLHSAYPTTVEQEPRLADPRILVFKEFFGRLKERLALAEIDLIFERVQPDELEQWRANCAHWQSRGSRVDGVEHIGNLTERHIRMLHVKPGSTAPPPSYSASRPIGKPTIGQIKAIPKLTGEAKAKALQEAEIKVAAMLAKRAAREAAQLGGTL